MINWLLKQLFYFRYFVLNRKYKDPFFKVSDGRYYIPFKPTPTSTRFAKPTFVSESFTDGQWNNTTPWGWKDCWNTYDKTTFPKKYVNDVFVGYDSKVKGFKQQYGRFYFKAKLDGLVTKNQWPALWLLEISDNFYFEIDIELLKNDLSYTIHWNHSGKQDKSDPNYHVMRSNFASHKLYRSLQRDYHLFLIDWSKEWVKMYINGILTCCFKNEIHVPMQIICSKINAQKVIVQK